jgi:predicted SpoU family rRNA methylase
MKKISGLLFLISFLFVGCISSDFENNLPVIETDVQSYELAAQVVEGQDMIAGAFRVKSNQSWSAQVVYSEGNTLEWLSLLQKEYENVSGKMEESMITFVLGRNRVEVQREAIIRLTSKDCEATVKVIQKAAHLYLEFDQEEVSVVCGANSTTLNVYSNTSWNVAVKEGATAQVTLDVSRGNEDGVVTVSFTENFSADETKTAVLVFTTPGGITKEVTFTQSAAVPYVQLVDGQSLEMSPEATSAEFRLLANIDWTAIVKDASKWEGFVLNTESGGINDPILSVSFPESHTKEPKQAVLAIAPEGGVPTEIVITQSGMVIVVDFATQPFTTLIGTASTSNPGEFVMKWGGAEYDFVLRAGAETDKLFYAPDTGSISTGALVMSKAWVDFPAIEGLTLSKVSMVSGATKKKWLVTENSGTSPVKGGSSFEISSPGDEYTWTLESPEKNHSYSLYTSVTNSRVKKIKLVYR